MRQLLRDRDETAWVAVLGAGIHLANGQGFRWPLTNLAWPHLTSNPRKRLQRFGELTRVRSRTRREAVRRLTMILYWMSTSGWKALTSFRKATCISLKAHFFCYFSKGLSFAPSPPRGPIPWKSQLCVGAATLLQLSRQRADHCLCPP